MFGCAGADFLGRDTDFVRPEPEALKNGQTSYAQVVAMMGPPVVEGSITRNEVTLKTAMYRHVSLTARALHAGATAARSARFYFKDEILVGHEFDSSWAVDPTDFDEGSITHIIKGKTSREQVFSLLGPPCGHYMAPLIPEATGEAAVYVFSERRGGGLFNFKDVRKRLVVSFDAAGIVADLEFTFKRSRRN